MAYIIGGVIAAVLIGIAVLGVTTIYLLAKGFDH